MQRRTALRRIAAASIAATATTGVASAIDDATCEEPGTDNCTLPLRYCEPEYCPPECCMCACEDGGPA